MRKRRKTAEILLSRPVARPKAKSQDGPIYPQMMPARRGLTLAAYWEEIAEKAKKRKATRSPRPRLLDPLTKQAQEPQEFGEKASGQPAGLTRCSRNPNRAGAASTLAVSAALPSWGVGATAPASVALSCGGLNFLDGNEARQAPPLYSSQTTKEGFNRP